MENPEIISFENEEKPKKNSISILDLYGEELTKKTYITNPAIAREDEIEHDNRQVVELAKRCGSEVHHLKSAIVDFVVGDFAELSGGRVLFRVGCVDSVNASALKHHVGFDLNTAERRASVGGEERVASAARQDGYLAGIHGFDGFPLAIVFADREHIDSGEHLSCLSVSLEAAA